MRQLVHIFLKDMCFLRLEICVFVVLTGVYASGVAHSGVSAPEILMEAAAMYLIARLIHAESLPGDRQFWLTRPYNRVSLAGAKLLFIAAFVCAPICASQIALLAAGNFPLLPHLTGLVWSQLLIFGACVLVAAVAALTSGTVLFMLSALVLAAAAVIVQLVYPVSGMYRSTVPSALDWIPQDLALAIFGSTAAFILFWQYRYRATGASRLAGIGGIAFAAAAFLWTPSGILYGLQSRLSPRSAAGTVRISIDPRATGRQTWFTGGRDPLYRRARVPLPIAIQGLPAGVEARADALSISFEWAGNQSWTPDVPPGLNPRYDTPGASLADATVLMAPEVYQRNRDALMTLSGAIYVTLFGETETRSLKVSEAPVNFQDGLQCFTGAFDYFYCRFFFRWPARLVYAESGGQRFNLPNSLISYSPFPAEPGSGLMEIRSGGQLKTRELTLITRRPLAHFWQHFTVSGLRLSDFDGRLSSK